MAKKIVPTCKVAGCVRPMFSRERCQPHYMQWFRGGKRATLEEQGRPKVLAEIQISTRVEEHKAKAFRAMCEAQGSSTYEVLRKWIDSWYENTQKAPPAATDASAQFNRGR